MLGLIPFGEKRALDGRPIPFQPGANQLRGANQLQAIDIARIVGEQDFVIGNA